MIALRFVVSFILLSLPLTWLWVEWGSGAYAWILRNLGGAMYSLVGLDGLRIPARERFINFIPFIALVIATPRLTGRRRLIGLFAGIGLLFFSHLVFNAIAERSSYKASFPPILGTFSDALPFALWALIARQFIREMTRSAVSRGDPS